jgi:oligopeptide/dipeptide ABC transporter ATP-binding protein
MADRMAVMYLGRFVETGDSEQIFRAPRHPYTAALLAANPSPDPDAEPERIELRGEVPSLLRRPAGCEFHTRCPRVREDCKQSPADLTVEADGHAYRCFYPMDKRRL